MARRGVSIGIALVSALLVSVVTAGALAPTTPRAGAGEAAAPGAGVPHPRVLFAPGDEPMLQERLTREPYRTVFLRMHERMLVYNSRPLGDDRLEVHRDLSRAAKALAFEYVLDRTVIGGEIVPFPDEAARQAVGDRVRELLLNLYPRSRLAVPAPIGGWDRDISTSEEIVSYATALDLMLGSDYDLGADRTVIVDRLASVTGELHQNFVDPATASGYANLHQNNHRSKSGAAMAIAAIVLADDVPEAADWFDYGILQVDDVLRHMLVTGDGAYAEGPFYYRLTMQNLAPLVSAWERVLGDASWNADGVEVDAPATDPLFRRTQRWMLDLTLPDGTMAPIDDGNPGRAYYFGAVPPSLPEAGAHYWRWASAPPPYEIDGSIELGPDTIATYDDSIAPGPPSWAPTQFYVEGGTASLRSDWSADAVMAVVLGEHDTASEFGRDRAGNARAPQSHEHPDGGSFLLHAFGERLLLDPGYLSFSQHGLVNKPEDHNMVLVDGQGPPDYLAASFAWLSDPQGRPPAEGQSTLHATLDAGGLDAASVATWYRGTEIARRFLLADDRYLVVGDTARGSGGALSWVQHGNGGGTSGGTYVETPSGARWEFGGARVDSAVDVADQAVALDTTESIHEAPGNLQRTHAVRRATVPAGSADALQIFYPTRAGEAPPVLTALDEPGQAGIEVLDAAGDRRVVVRNGTEGDDLRLVDEHLDGSLRLAYAEGATELAHGGVPLITTDAPGTLALRLGDGTADVVAQTADQLVEVGDVGFTPTAVDGACSFSVDGGVTRVRAGRERRLTLRAGTTSSAPAADPGGFQRVAPGSLVALDGSRSCDADGDSLTYRWELVSAPAGSSWTLTGAGTAHPQLLADRPGPYRVRLVVTDAQGLDSLEQEVLVIAGDRCADGIDNDTDGRIDSDDADCDGTDPTEVEPPDDVEPDAPASVSAVGGPRQVTLSWDPPAYDGGTPVTGYRVLDGSGTEVATTAPTVTSVDLIGLPAGPSASYRVVAVNAVGESPASAPTDPVEVAPATSFSDVPEDRPFFAEIVWAASRGLAQGRPDGSFAPGATLTRQEAAAFLHRLAGSPAGPFDDPGFVDVPPSHPFFAEVAWLAANDVTGGFADGTFRPGALVTRQELAAFLHRLAGSPAGPFDDPGFVDVPPSHPFFAEVAWLASTGITLGAGGDTFAPTAPTTRQAIVALLHRSTRAFVPIA